MIHGHRPFYGGVKDEVLVASPTSRRHLPLKFLMLALLTDLTS